MEPVVAFQLTVLAGCLMVGVLVLICLWARG